MVRKVKSSENPFARVDSEFSKFPRTSHLFLSDQNSVARDDLLVDPYDARCFCENIITIEEKIDGSNIGLSLGGNGQKILAQNRSHYVTKESQTQFKYLRDWIDNNASQLYKILKNDCILFGEWMYAKHSIEYDRIPDYFVAFDIYDRKAQKYVSVQKRDLMLNGTGIPVVRTLYQGRIDTLLQDEQKNEKNKEKINLKLYKHLFLNFLDEPSAYCKQSASYIVSPYPQVGDVDTRVLKKIGKNQTTNKTHLKYTPVEGIYIRHDKGDYLESRCKLVREDFIQQIEDHWSKQKIVKNQIDYEWKYSL